MNYTYDAFIAAINRSPLLAGICMLVLNVGSRYIDLGLSKSQENLIAKSLAREVLIFAICFMGTKDVALSIVLTGSFIVLSDHVLNESSPYCPMPGYIRGLMSASDMDRDGSISKTEFKRAMKALAALDK